VVLLSVFSALLGLAFAIYNFAKVASIKMQKSKVSQPEPESDDEDPYRMSLAEQKFFREATLSSEDYNRLVDSGQTISLCALKYLLYEYLFVALCVILFGFFIWVFIFHFNNI
jgi:hypothetical protein